MADKTALHPRLLAAKNIVTKVETVETHEVCLNGKHIREILGIPHNARVKVSVPGGGDWSHTDLDLDHGHTLDISWEVVT